MLHRILFEWEVQTNYIWTRPSGVACILILYSTDSSSSLSESSNWLMLHRILFEWEVQTNYIETRPSGVAWCFHLDLELHSLPESESSELHLRRWRWDWVDKPIISELCTVHLMLLSLASLSVFSLTATFSAKMLFGISLLRCLIDQLFSHLGTHIAP